MRYTQFLRSSVLLFAGAATVLALVAIAGAQARDDTTLLYFCFGWWALAAITGMWLGRREEVMRGVGRLLSGARAATSLPELDAGAIIFNRLWALIVITIAAGAVAFLIPQVPAVACGYAIAVALAWRKQYRAVEAIEQRDGVQFHVEQTSPFKPTRLVRTAGLRRLEPTEAEAEA